MYFEDSLKPSSTLKETEVRNIILHYVSVKLIILYFKHKQKAANNNKKGCF